MWASRNSEKVSFQSGSLLVCQGAPHLAVVASSAAMCCVVVRPSASISAVQLLTSSMPKPFWIKRALALPWTSSLRRARRPRRLAGRHALAPCTTLRLACRRIVCRAMLPHKPPAGYRRCGNLVPRRRAVRDAAIAGAKMCGQGLPSTPPSALPRHTGEEASRCARGRPALGPLPRVPESSPRCALPSAPAEKCAHPCLATAALRSLGVARRRPTADGTPQNSPAESQVEPSQAQDKPSSRWLAPQAGARRWRACRESGQAKPLAVALPGPKQMPPQRRRRTPHRTGGLSGEVVGARARPPLEVLWAAREAPAPERPDGARRAPLPGMKTLPNKGSATRPRQT